MADSQKYSDIRSKNFSRLPELPADPPDVSTALLLFGMGGALEQVLPLGERDVLPDGTPLYQLVLEYEVDQGADCSELPPRWPGLQGVLYER